MLAAVIGALIVGSVGANPQPIVLLTWNPAPLLAGTPLGPEQLNATASVPGTFTYNPGPGTVLDFGPSGFQDLSATFTPDDDVTYDPVGFGVRLVIYSPDPGSPIQFDHQVPFIFTRLITNSFGAWAFDATASRLYVSGLGNGGAGPGRVINLLQETVQDGIDLGSNVGGPVSLIADFGRRRSYAHAYLGNNSWAINISDLDAGTLIESASVPPAVGSIQAAVLNPVTGDLFLLSSSPGGGSIHIFDPTAIGADQFRFLGLIPTSMKESHAPALDATSGLLYFTGAQHPRPTHVVDVNPVRPTYGSVVATIAGVLGPYVIDRARQLVYGATYSGWLVEHYGGTDQPTGIAVIDGNPASPTAHTLVNRIDLAAAAAARQFVVALAHNQARDRLYAVLGTTTTAMFNDFQWPGDGALVSIDLATRIVSPAWRFGDYLTASDGGTDTYLVVDPQLDRLYMWSGSRGSSFSGAGSFTWELDFGPQPLVFRDPQPSSQPIASGATDPVAVGTVSVDFGAVAAGGDVTVNVIDAASANLTLPGQFAIDGGVGFDISTTASVTGPIDVCVNMSAVTDPDVFAALTIMHGEAGEWVPYPTTRNLQTGMICAQVQSLSPFAVARFTANFQTEKLFDTARSFKAGSTVPIKIRLLGQSGANVSSASIQVRSNRLRRVSSSSSYAVQDAGHANADGDFRYDPSLNGYVFNLSTKGLSPGTYELVFTAAGDRAYHRVSFQVR